MKMPAVNSFRRRQSDGNFFVFVSLLSISLSIAFYPSSPSLRYTNQYKANVFPAWENEKDTSKSYTMKKLSSAMKGSTKKQSWGSNIITENMENFRDENFMKVNKQIDGRTVDRNIEETIDQMVTKQSSRRILTAGDHPPHKYPGILGDSRGNNDSLTHIPSKPACGTVLISPSSSTETLDEKSSFLNERLTIRVAEHSDDVQVTELRSKVFSKLFGVGVETFIHCCRDIIVNRRKRGAVGLVATVPLSKSKYRYATRNRSTSRRQRFNERVIGGVECSIHEFYGTRLGYSRPATKLLYITEVAVSPNFQGSGIGKRLLLAIDIFAKIRDAESIYLHVDVTNDIALNLYQKAGYSICEKNLTNLEFTKSLNLHDGATRGRNHFLLCKHLQRPTHLPIRNRETTINIL